ncbi:MAG: P-type conjugative transfer protein TrbG [Micropepsaceae bacterium]
MNLSKLLASGVSMLALTACASQGAPPPQIAYDNEEFRQAFAAPEPAKPVEVLTIPEPLPLPGQLKPLPGNKLMKVRSGPPQTRVDAANRVAMQEPTKDGYVNAVQVYPFTTGALYRLYAAPEKVSDIALEPGEKLIAVSAGDTLRWIVGDTTSGAGDSAQVHILVKPTTTDLKTNVVISTNRRVYHLELESTERTYMAAVSWRYPVDQLIALRRNNDEAVEVAAQIIDQGVALEQLRFRYEISGDRPAWRPVRAFDDTHKVYIEFPARIDQGEAPPLFVVGPRGDAELVNYRVRGRYYIVDRLFAAAELRLGADPQAIVRISRTDEVAGAKVSQRVGTHK